MSIKSYLRAHLPIRLVRGTEEAYRRGRAQIVSAYYGYPARDLHVLAVTGTNGKTTTANYLNEILKSAGYTTALFTTAVIEVAGDRKLNDLNATVATTARMQQFFRDAKKAQVDFVVLEITSHALHQHKLATVPIEMAIMTNLTQDHLDYHKTMEKYAAAKGKLFENTPRFIVLNRDDAWYDFFSQYSASERSITYGKTERADVQLTNTTLQSDGSDTTLELDGAPVTVHSHLPGEYNLYNLAAAASAAYLLGISPSAIAAGADGLSGVPGRYEHVTGAPFAIVIDYAHTPDAMEKLFDAARATTKGKLFVVFGATGDRDKGKRPIMGQIAAEKTDRVFLTDDESYSEDPAAIRAMVLEGVAPDLRGKVSEYDDRRDAIAAALSEAKPDDTVLITGMGHEQYRIVNGKRIPWNDGDVVRELLNEKTKPRD